MRLKALKIISIALALALAVLFVAKFAGPATLRLYIETGIGTCETIPILCKVPGEQVVVSSIDRDYVSGLVTQKFPRMQMSVPKGFAVVQETIKRPYFKRKPIVHTDPVVYCLHQEKYFFTDLFPEVKKAGVFGNYEFMKRVMHADLKKVKNMADAFFVIMKSIFTPDLGDQKQVVMIAFAMPDRKGFINYNLDPEGDLYDCVVINKQGGFFKVYIKDVTASLDLEKVFAIISSLKELGH